MSAFLRKVRGALGIGVTWGVVWAGIFAALSITIGIFDPDSIDPGEGPLNLAAIGGLLGFTSGVLFGALLALADGRKVLRKLSLGRAALWGALGTAVYPVFATGNYPMLLFLCPIGAALAAGSVAIAKRAELGSAEEHPELPR